MRPGIGRSGSQDCVWGCSSGVAVICVQDDAVCKGLSDGGCPSVAGRRTMA